METPVLKTREEWFDTLEEPTRVMAIQNTKAKKLKEKCMSLSCALEAAFVWVETTEGHKYWEDVYLNIRNEKQV
jgi:hypothetical protein